MTDCLVVAGTCRDYLCHTRSLLYRIATWELLHRTLNVFVDSGSELAALSSGIWDEVEDRTVLYLTTQVCALVDSLLK